MTRRVASHVRIGAGLMFLWLAIAPSVGAAGPMLQTTNNPTYGSVIVSDSGLTLYHLVREQNGQVACVGPCATLWPPYTVPAGVTGATVAAGITGNVSIVTRPDGSRQIALNGWPLYFFARDAGPGDMKGEGFAGVWFAVRPNSVPLAAVLVSRTPSHSCRACNVGF